METEIILLDTSILIDFYRKKNKSKTLFNALSVEHRFFAISVITHFEIYVGSRTEQREFWDNLFHDFIILPFNAEISFLAAQIDADLRKRRKQIEIPDLFIAATAIINNLPCATLNRKHFELIEQLKLIDFS